MIFLGWRRACRPPIAVRAMVSLLTMGHSAYHGANRLARATSKCSGASIDS
jgi:hypothetical protein